MFRVEPAAYLLKGGRGRSVKLCILLLSDLADVLALSDTRGSSHTSQSFLIYSRTMFPYARSKESQPVQFTWGGLSRATNRGTGKLCVSVCGCCEDRRGDSCVPGGAGCGAGGRKCSWSSPKPFGLDRRVFVATCRQLLRYLFAGAL